MAAGLVDSYHPLVDGDLTLRRAVPADAADICEVYGEADTRHWMLWEGEDPPDEAEALATVERSERAWAEGWGEVFRIVVDGHVVGGAMIRFTQPGTGETAYFLRQSARGRGLATRALLLVADWGFREHGLMRVFARADPANAASVRLGERARLRVVRTAAMNTDSSAYSLNFPRSAMQTNRCSSVQP